jgi:endonuclease/exonuclease/phosphatase family metal-dependent hydrolase
VLHLSCLTLNIRCQTEADGPNDWPLRKQRVFDFLRAQKADLVALQEVLPQQRLDIQSELRGYRWLGRGRGIGGSGEACMIGIRPQMSLRDWGTFWLSEETDEEGSVGWDACLPRICTWVVVGIGGNFFRFSNLHLDHLGIQARQKSAELVCVLFSDDLPTVIAGDFNCEAFDGPAQVMTSRFKDCHRTLYPDCSQGTYHAFGRVESAERPCIDYIFASPEFDVCSSVVLTDVEPHYSDHFGIKVKLSYNSSSFGR